MTKKKTQHVVLGNNSLRCLNCGDEHQLDMSGGISLNMMAGLARGYTDDHKACKPSARGRARFEYTTPEQWLMSWDTGESSKTIYNFMHLGGVTKRAAIPYDPNDFGRCYRLLKVAPEWRADFNRIGLAIPAWTGLALFWTELEQLYENELPSGRCPKLYARIQELIA